MHTTRSTFFTRVGAMIALGCTLLTGAADAQKAVFGSYTFNDTLNGVIGKPLKVVGAPISYMNDTIAGQAARVAFVPNGTYFTVDHRMVPNGGGAYVNQYTIIMDIRLPANPADFFSLYQTSVANANDGDWFIRYDGGMGISGDYTDASNFFFFSYNIWHRIALVIDTTSAPNTAATQYRSFIDGVLQNVVQSPGGWGKDGRYSLDPTFHIFADEDGETADVYINNLQVRNYAMTDAEVLALGGATNAPIPIPGAIISGKLNLAGIADTASLQPINFTFRPSGGGSDFDLGTLIGTDGEFQLNVPKANYNVRAVGKGYLADVFAANVSAGDLSGVTGTLFGGDANADNSVDVLDLAALIEAFDAVDGDANWNNGVADFNHDGSVDVLDLAVLITDFDLVGEDLP